jgi:hypothetical protein
MSGIHVARQGFVTKAALPNVARQRGPIAYACSLLLNANGTNGSGDSNRVLDSSPNAYAVARNLLPVQSQLSPLSGGDGKWSQYFDGATASYLTVASNAAFAMGAGDFTLECWYNPAVKTALYPLIAGNHTTAWAANAWELCDRHATAPTKFMFQAYNYSSSTPLLTSTTTVVVGVWYHIAVTRSGNVWSLFINGVLEATTTASFSVDGGSTNPLQIGRGDASTSALLGSVSNLRVVKGTAVYTANFTPPTAPLTAIANTVLLTCQDAIHVDNSTNKFAITRSGNVVGQAYGPFGGVAVVGGAAYFPGSGAAQYLSVPVPITTGQFTVEAWVYVSSYSSSGAIIVSNRAWSTGYVRGYGVRINTSGKVIIDASNGSWNVWNAIYTSSGSIPTGAWCHIALVRDSSDVIRCYINGVADATTVTYAASLDLTSGSYGTWRLSIGGEYVDNNYNTTLSMVGYLSNIRIVTGSAVYTVNFTPPTTALTAVTGTQLLLKYENPAYKDSSSYSQAVQSDTGTPAIAGASPFSGYPGSLSLNGASALSVGYPGYDWLGKSSWTIEAWVNNSTVSSNRTVMSCQNFTTNRGYGWDLRFEGQTLVMLVTNGSMETAAISATFATMTTATWYHLAVVNDNGTIKLFWNGALAASATFTMNQYLVTPSTPVLIGRRGGTSLQEYFTGYIANPRIAKGVALYAAAFTPATVPLSSTAETQMLLKLDNIGVTDSSANGYAVNVFGDAQISTAQSKFGGSSLRFDGAGDYLTVASATPLLFNVSLFHLECWVYRAATGVVHTIASKGTSTTGWMLQINASDKLVWTLNTSTVLLTSTSSIPANTWTHVAVSRDISNVMRMFINGVQEATSSNSNAYTQTDVVVIGADRSFANFFNGYIEDVRIFRDGVKYIAAFTAPTAELPPTDDCYRPTANTVYGVYQLA